MLISSFTKCYKVIAIHFIYYILVFDNNYSSPNNDISISVDYSFVYLYGYSRLKYTLNRLLYSIRLRHIYIILYIYILYKYI